MARFQPADRQLGATEFAGDELADPIKLIRAIKRTRWLADFLRKAWTETIDTGWGRRPEPGDWPLIYVAFVISKVPDIQPWHAMTSDALWREAGFAKKPPYSRVYEAFIKLEGIRDGFREAAGQLIRRARAHEPRVGAHVHYDSTEAETNAALRHVCCPKKSGGRGQRPKRVPTSQVRAERQQAAEEPTQERPKPVIGDVAKVRMVQGRKQFLIDGHWYETTDNDAGIRAYIGQRHRPKFWHGGYHAKVIDHFTGAVLAAEVFNASTQEHIFYPELAEMLEQNLGGRPQTAVFDKGFSIEGVFEYDTRRGIATVAPFRRHVVFGRDMGRPDREAYDRHGIPRCKHCGAETKFVRFSANGEPRIWFHCKLEITAACKKDQSISCNKDFRMLIPLWRDDELYFQLRESHSHYERVQDDQRQRYLLGPDNRTIRPKRRGQPVQSLRTQAALMIEWFRILVREGWLGSPRRNLRPIETPNGMGKRALGNFRKFRRSAGITSPYGPAAEREGIGSADPPSVRAAARRAELAAKSAEDS